MLVESTAFWVEDTLPPDRSGLDFGVALFRHIVDGGFEFFFGVNVDDLCRIEFAVEDGCAVCFIGDKVIENELGKRFACVSG